MANTEIPAQARTCPNGHEVRAGVAFCTSCGVTVSPTAASPSRGRGRFRRWALTAVAVVVVGVAVAIALTASSDRSSEADDRPRPDVTSATLPQAPPGSCPADDPSAFFPRRVVMCLLARWSEGDFDGMREFGTANAVEQMQDIEALGTIRLAGKQPACTNVDQRATCRIDGNGYLLTFEVSVQVGKGEQVTAVRRGR